MSEPRKVNYTGTQYEQFVERLKDGHTGIQNAVTSGKIEQALHISGVQVRAMKHHAITERWELVGATTESGYFYIDTPEELDRCINDAQSRINSLKELIAGYKKAWDFRKEVTSVENVPPENSNVQGEV